MDQSNIEYITNLDEDRLRTTVVIPLLSSMGYKEIVEYHGGSAEKGKDVICYYIDPSGEKKYISIVLKRGDIHGSVSKSGNAGEILIQITQSFDEPYTNVYSLKELTIDECWVVTSGRIKNTAVESIRGMLKKSNLDKLVRFVDGNKLYELINQYMPDYWSNERLLLSFLHDIRSPISATLGATDILRRYAPRETSSKDILFFNKIINDIQGWMQYLSHMTHYLYILMVPELHLHFEVCDLNEVLMNIVQEMRQFCIWENKTILYEAQNNRKCLIDHSLFSLAIWCLLDNAIKFSSHANKPVSVSVEEKASLLQIVIRDYGIGIPLKDKEMIMKPYYRASNAVMAYVTGTGNGLVIANKIIQAHKGEIILRRRQNPTEFVVNMPREE